MFTIALRITPGDRNPPPLLELLLTAAVDTVGDDDVDVDENVKVELVDGVGFDVGVTGVDSLIGVRLTAAGLLFLLSLLKLYPPDLLNSSVKCGLQ